MKSQLRMILFLIVMSAIISLSQATQVRKAKFTE